MNGAVDWNFYETAPISGLLTMIVELRLTPPDYSSETLTIKT